MKFILAASLSLFPVLLSSSAMAGAQSLAQRDYDSIRNNAALLSQNAEGLSGGARLHNFTTLLNLAKDLQAKANDLRIVAKEEVDGTVVGETQLDATYGAVQASYNALVKEWATENYNGYPLVVQDYQNVQGRYQVVETLWGT